MECIRTLGVQAKLKDKTTTVDHFSTIKKSHNTAKPKKYKPTNKTPPHVVCACKRIKSQCILLSYIFFMINTKFRFPSFFPFSYLPLAALGLHFFFQEEWATLPSVCLKKGLELMELPKIFIQMQWYSYFVCLLSLFHDGFAQKFIGFVDHKNKIILYQTSVTESTWHSTPCGLGCHVRKAERRRCQCVREGKKKK